MTARDANGPDSALAKSSGRFFVTYLLRGLRGRVRQVVIVAVGLAVGVAALVTLTAASTGVSGAQAAVLHSLYGVGTDISVTSAASSGGSGSSGSSQGMITRADAGKDFFRLPLGLGLLDSAALATISKMSGVAEVAGGLGLSETRAGPAPASGGPPSLTSTSIDGVDVAHLKLGPYAAGTITSGRSFTAADAEADVAVVDAGYAAAHHLRVGSTITIAKTQFNVIGIISQPAASNPTNVFIPLGRAQAIAAYGGLHTLAGKLTAIYVSAASASAVPAVHSKIAALLPGATVTSSGDLASKVSGSLASATKLATDLGRWLAAAMLLAAFALAGLLTTAAVRRRVREFGTLKALGWRTRRIVAQIMAESLVTGVAGAAVGIGLGFVGAALIEAIVPTMTATVALNPGSTPPQGALINGGSLKTLTLPGGVHTISVHLHATVGATTILLAVVLAIGGAVLAGALGSWRAARLRPAHALVRVA